MTTHTPLTGREIHLAARPTGTPGPEIFRLVRADVPQPGPGQVLVRNTWMSVDPYMRVRMDADITYLPPFALDAPLDGGALGEVLVSRADSVPRGATVSHVLGWREYAVLDAADVTVVDTARAPAQAYLGALGTTGLTAYATFTDVAPVRRGDTVFVSAAAGAVGSVAGQIARKLGATTVIGSAGGPAKSRALAEDFGFDVALDHRAGPIGDQLAKAAPEGIDVYLDNVGGDHLEAALEALRPGGRVALVGAIGEYNADRPAPGPDNFRLIRTKGLSVRGMLVSDYFDLFPAFIDRASGWLADGTLRTAETVLDGLERAPEAFLGVLRGANTGKMLVRLG